MHWLGQTRHREVGAGDGQSPSVSVCVQKALTGIPALGVKPISKKTKTTTNKHKFHSIKPFTGMSEKPNNSSIKTIDYTFYCLYRVP